MSSFGKRSKRARTVFTDRISSCIPLLSGGKMPARMFPEPVFARLVFAGLALVGLVPWPGTLRAADPVRLDGHQAAVYDVKWLPGGESLVSASFDQTLKLWDVRERSVIRTMDGHTGIVLCVAVSPDGTLIASGASDNSIRLWDVPVNTPVATWSVHDGESVAMSRSPDGKRLATADAGGLVRLWDAESHEQQHEIRLPAVASVLGWSRNGQILAAGSVDGSVHLLNALEGTLSVSVAAHDAQVTGLEFSPNNSQFFTAGGDGAVRRWPVALKAADDGGVLSRDAAQLEHVADENQVHGLALMSNGAQYATAGADGQVKIWNASNSAPVRSLSGFEGAVRCVAFSADRRQVAAGGDDGTVCCWNATNGSALFRHHVDEAVQSLAYSPDSRKLVAVAGQAICSFDVAPLNPQPAEPPARAPAQTLKIEGVVPGDIAWESDSRRLHSLTGDGRIATWEIAATGPLATMTGHRGPVYGLEFSPDGRTLASGSNDRTVRLWDVETRKATRTLVTQDAGVYAVTWVSGEDQLLTAGADRTVRLYDARNGRELRVYEGPEYAVYSVACSPDGSLIAAGGMGIGDSRPVRLWDRSSPVARSELAGHQDDVYRLEFSSTGRRLLSTGYSGELRIWDVDQGTAVHEEKIGHVIYAGAFSPDGTRVAVASSDQAVLLLEVPAAAR